MSSVTDLLGAAWRGDSLERLSSQLHESQSATRKGLESALPLSMTGLASQFSTEQKAGELLAALQGNSMPHVDLAELGAMVQDASALGRLTQAGEGLLFRIFGAKLEAILETLAGQHGVSRTSASKLLGLAAPLVIGAIQKEVQSQHFDARGLSRYLHEEGRKASGLLPPKLASLLARDDPASHRGRVSYSERALETHSYDTPVYVPETPNADFAEGPAMRTAAPVKSYPPVAQRRSGAPWWIAWALGALALFALFRRTGDTERAAQPSSTKTQTIEPSRADEPGRDVTESGAPLAENKRRGTGSIAAAPPEEGRGRAGEQTAFAPPIAAENQSMQDEAGRAQGTPETNARAPQAAAPREQNLAKPAGSGAQQGAQVYSVHFASGSQRPEERAELARVVESLKQTEGARVLLQGHADPRGDEAMNQRLSLARVASVKRYLTRHGVDAERIETAALGISDPRDSDAESRRVEIEIMRE